MIFLMVAAAAVGVVQPDPAHLRPTEQCFTMTHGGTAVGKTWQAIRAARYNGARVWDVIVHQRLDDGSFEMRDHFVLDRTALRPISFDSRRGTDRDSRGWHRIALRYSANRIVGTRETKEGVTRIDVPLDHVVWEGNLWGMTFASLPLRAGGRYSVPFWQYDKGFGAITVNVVGREVVEVPGGRVTARVLEAGDDPAPLARYLVASNSPTEVGYSAGSLGQSLGEDCTALPAKSIADVAHSTR